MQCYARIGNGHTNLDQDHLEKRDSQFACSVTVRPSEEETKTAFVLWSFWVLDKKEINPFRLETASPASSVDGSCWRSGGRRADLPALPEEVGSGHH